jgi:hypothetical protein
MSKIVTWTEGGNRPVTIQTFQLDPAGQKRLLHAASVATQSIKLEPGVTQPLPPLANQPPLKLEIQETFLDTGRKKKSE